MRVTRVGPASVAKVALVLYSVLGLIGGAIFAIAAVMGAAAGVASGEDNAYLGAIFGVGAIIVFPVLYGCLGALVGLLMAWLYNVAAGLVGGIEISLDSTGQ